MPFDPARKTSEATATDAKGTVQRIIKGAFTAVIGLTAPSPAAAGMADDLEKQGFRVLAVAAGPRRPCRLIGFIALSDPPRTDSTSLISELKALGVRTVMVTGDAPATATIVAHDVGLDGPSALLDRFLEASNQEDFAVFASILPEGKYDLVKAFQKDGHKVGMCGDGANDAPALRPSGRPSRGQICLRKSREHREVRRFDAVGKRSSPAPSNPRHGQSRPLHRVTTTVRTPRSLSSEMSAVDPRPGRVAERDKANQLQGRIGSYSWFFEVR